MKIKISVQQTYVSLSALLYLLSIVLFSVQMYAYLLLEQNVIITLKIYVNVDSLSL